MRQRKEAKHSLKWMEEKYIVIEEINNIHDTKGVHQETALILRKREFLAHSEEGIKNTRRNNNRSR